MHLGPAARQGARRSCASTRARPGTTTSRRSTANGDYEVDLPPEAAAAGVSRAARLGLFAGLSLPRVAARDAPAPDRHRPVQIRRVQAERVDQGRANPDYWKKGRPYLDGIEYTIIPNRSTAILAFVAGKFDMTFADRRDDPAAEGRARRRRRRRSASCAPTNVSANLIVNRDKPPFDNAESAPGDGAGARPQGLHRHPERGQGDIGGAMLPPPEGVWGMPPEMLRDAAGLRPGRREEPRRGARDHGEARLRPGQAAQVKVSTRNIADLSRPGGDPDRPAEGDLHRRRARVVDTAQLVSPRWRARTTRSAST